MSPLRSQKASSSFSQRQLLGTNEDHNLSNLRYSQLDINPIIKMTTHTPPAGAQSIVQILGEARSHLERITPEPLLLELQSKETTRPTYLIDIRPAAQREREGALALPQDISPNHQIHIIERNVLEWRLDPQADSRLKDIVDPAGYDTRVIVACSEGYTSSLAARELQRLGLRNATDLEGGYWAWKRFLENRETSV